MANRPEPEVDVTTELVHELLLEQFRELATKPIHWERARGWALNFAVIYLAHSDDDPVMGDIGNRLLTALLAGA